jgi:hypothetical protein
MPPIFLKRGFSLSLSREPMSPTAAAKGKIRRR